MIQYGGTSIGTALAGQDDTVFGAARAYVKALEEAASSLLKDSAGPITTLVPAAEGTYRDFMLKGDRAFRTDNYQEAYANFEITNDIGNHDPESFICLLHAQFALSRHSYAKAAYFLEQALKFMPELPVANLRPRGFYGNVNRYAEHLVALEEHVERDPTDGEALLVLAYFRWFGEAQDVAATRKALASSLAAALRKKDTYLVDAAETFWDGMVATGKVSGKLTPAGDSEAGTQPGQRPKAQAGAASPQGGAAGKRPGGP
jgi:hypothetical protein